MRAGKLDRKILVERHTVEVNDYGTQIETWSQVAEVRAQLVQSSTEEFIRSFGSSEETAVIFRIRHMDGLSVSDRVTEQGRHFNIKEIKELGRREGLELRCTSIG